MTHRAGSRAGSDPGEERVRLLVVIPTLLAMPVAARTITDNAGRVV
jgi:hypothetical protein